MDVKGKYIIWVRCDHCTRAYKDIDRLIQHKNEEHPEIFRSLLRAHRKRAKKRKKEVTFDLSVNVMDESTASAPKKPDDVDPKPKRRSIMKSKKENNEEVESAPAPPKATPARRGRRRSSSAARAVKQEPQEQPVDNITEEQPYSPQIPMTEVIIDVPTTTNNDSTTPQDDTPAEETEVAQTPLKGPAKGSTVKLSQREKTNAFHVLFMHSMKMQKQQKECGGTTPKLKSERTTRQSTLREKGNSGSSPEGKHSCPECSRQLESAETLKLHMKLHRTFSFNSKSNATTCKRCGRMLTSPPYKCTDCPKTRMVFDFPQLVIKQEPKDAPPQVEAENGTTDGDGEECEQQVGSEGENDPSDHSVSAVSENDVSLVAPDNAVAADASQG